MAEQEEPYQRGMVIVAHADDAEWGCSGTVARWCSLGWEVVYVLCTDGSKGSDDPEMTSEELVRTRKREQLEAGKVLGLKDVVFLGYEDLTRIPSPFRGSWRSSPPRRFGGPFSSTGISPGRWSRSSREMISSSSTTPSRSGSSPPRAAIPSSPSPL